MDSLAIPRSIAVIRLTPSRPGGVRLLCLGAHPDDIEIGAGGTILRWAHEGTLGSVGWVVLSGTEVRAAEARTASDRFLDGVSDRRVWIESFRDGHFPNSWSQIKETLDSIRSEWPADIVLVPRRDDWHQDHRTLGELAWTAFRDQLILEYEIPKWDGDLATPNVYVDLPHWAIEQKAQLIVELFPSQTDRSWFAPHTFEALARVRGVESRAADGYAEGFHAHKLVL